MKHLAPISSNEIRKGGHGDVALRLLSESEVYRDYASAFTAATKLPLSLNAPEMVTVIHHPAKAENPFCALLANTNQSCAACYALQRRVEEGARLQPKTLKCFAGLCETAVPVRVGENLIGFLHTGQILLAAPGKAKFNRIAKTLVTWGAQVDLKRLEEAYFNTRVLPPKQYEALIRLLTIFAAHLASCSNALSLAAKGADSPAIDRARVYISEHSEDDLSLGSLSRIVNMSANYFSAKFKEATGLNFVEYVARVRIEKARVLLQNPNLRISEVALQVGFRSLSQFNRTFKNVLGMAPREHRAAGHL